MTEILTDLSRPALIRASRLNMEAYFRQVGRAPATEYFEGDGFVRWRAPMPYPWFNGVLVTRQPDAGAEQQIRSAQTYFSAQGVPAITWWIAEGLDPSAWHGLLIAHGFALDTDTPGMAADLAQLVEPSPVSGLDIRTIRTTDEMRAWAHTFVLGYELPPDWEPHVADLVIGMGLDLPMRYYHAFLNGEPVGTAALFVGAGVASVQMVATIPTARRLGIGAAVTGAPLTDARALGYRAAILQSSHQGFNVYRRMGFEHIYNLEDYYWSPAQPA
ncbi:MAG: GNAT family N-acetyltransferase [Chloroflexi bacterium]|nr:GNAT family N-acetyltransferase [Chloroflexota bacterium]